MKRSGMIRRIIITLMIITFLSGNLGGLAEGILPSLTQDTRTAMPSIGEALQRDPDSGTENADGSMTECYTNFSNADYETFSVYLQEQGAVLANYKLEDNVLTAEIRANDASFFLNYDIGSGEATVTYPAGTYGKKAQSAEKRSTPEGQKGDSEQYKKTGNTVTFGRYEQDDNLENGPEAIEWIVLDYDEKENKALLLSKYGLDAVAYNRTFTIVPWENSSLRMWLNNTFLSAAFNEGEKNAILVTEVDNGPTSHENGARDGNNTQDRVFLLSYTEAGRYLGLSVSGADRTNLCAAPTPYAIAQGAFISESYKTADGEPAGKWWLRSTKEGFPKCAVAVQEFESFRGEGVNTYSVSVRPVLWLDLNAVERGLTLPAENDNQENADQENHVAAKSENGIASYKNPGNIVTFGQYEQDNNPENGPEAIEWIVLDYDEKENKALLISKYGLDTQPYNAGEEDEAVTWESCSLRRWLNSEFKNNAFTRSEQAAIPETEVDNSSSQGYSKWNTDGGNNTKDRIFLLSYKEADNYYGLDSDTSNILPRAALTPYLESTQGGQDSLTYFSNEYDFTTDGDRAVMWWLRSPGQNQQAAASVGSDGRIEGNTFVSIGSVVVRPTLWLDLGAVEKELMSSAENRNQETIDEQNTPTPSKGGYQEADTEEMDGENNAEAENGDGIALYRKPGSVVTFGTYEQDNNLENGSEAIEWIVLDYDGNENKALLLSKYGLDALAFHNEWSMEAEITWETCDARRWLNGIFLRSAFNLEEQKAILTTEVDNSKSKIHSRWELGSNNTEDQIFLLSFDEANRYFDVSEWESDDNNVKSRVAPTAYAIARGVEISDQYRTEEDLPDAKWGLRSNSYNLSDSGFVNELGSAQSGGFELVAARPALWVNVETIEELSTALMQNDNHDEEDSAEAERKAKMAAYSRIGNIVTYGRYEQDNNLENGLEPIEWIVLDYDGKNNRSLLISKYGLDTITFDQWSTKHDCTWEDCRARKWLNSYFLYSAFNKEERKAIPITEVDESESQDHLRHVKRELQKTQDRIFLLSNKEAELYFGATNAAFDYEPYIRARAAPTTYAIAQGAYASDEFKTAEGLPAGSWLLRTYSGDCQGMLVNQGGTTNNEEFNTKHIGATVVHVARPVFWLDLNAVEDLLQSSAEKGKDEEDPEEAERKVIIDSYSRAGNIVTYGRYEQDNDLTNGPEPIEWFVLTYDEANNRAMLISKYGLDTLNFYNEWDPKLTVTWETCNARKWLNNVFLYSAFNEDERKAIPTTEVDNSDNLDLTKKQTVEVNNTQDRIFLLSNTEVKIYFEKGNSEVDDPRDYDAYFGQASLRAAPTPYAIARGAFISDQFRTWEGLPAGQWTTRTSSDYVREGGVFGDAYIPGLTGRGTEKVARPVFWLDLDTVEKILVPSASDDNHAEPDGETAVEAERKTIIDSYSRAGNIVTYGQYEQDNNPENGPEPIEWIVLSADDTKNRAMLISKYGLDVISFDEWNPRGDTTWENCRARKWLNNYFLYSAFDEKERRTIVFTEADNSDGKEHVKDKEIEVNNTQDQIFLLNKSEAALYLGVQEGNGASDPKEYDPFVMPRVAPTPYAIAHGAFVSDQFQTAESLPAGQWLLRTYAGDCTGEPVSQAGVFGGWIPGQTGSGQAQVARPVFWLDLDAAAEVLLSSEEDKNQDDNPEEAERKVKTAHYSRPGNIVTFGHYEQDNDPENGPEAIEWIVLTYDEENNRAMLVSKYGLDVLEYHNVHRFGQQLVWEICNAREWLNDTFLNTAFSEEEQKAIPIMELDNSDRANPLIKLKGELNNTQDRIFLLSKTEAGIYFNLSMRDEQTGSRIAPTFYAIAQGAFISDTYQTAEGLPAGRWQLRTPCDDYSDGMVVNQSGNYYDYEIDHKHRNGGNGSLTVARPALWLDLNADIF